MDSVHPALRSCLMYGIGYAMETLGVPGRLVSGFLSCPMSSAYPSGWRCHKAKEDDPLI